MKDVKQNLTTESEPTVRHGATYLSMWIIGVLGVLVYWAFSYVDTRGGDYNAKVYEPFRSTNELAAIVPKDPFTEAMIRGRIAYQTYCANCHQVSGAGASGIAPPLAGSEWVTALGPNRLIRIPLRGLAGPIQVKGVDYNMNMLAIGAGGAMTDQQIADVLTFIRNSWGNKGSMITEEQVAKVHADVQNRDAQYTGEELLKLPEEIP